MGLASSRRAVGHTQGVYCVAWSPDGEFLATASEDTTVRLWEGKTEEHHGKPMTGHVHDVTSVCWSPDGQLLASGSADRTVCVWDVEERTMVGEPMVGHDNTVSCVAFAPDGIRVASASWDHTVRIWHAQAGKEVSEVLHGHTGWVDSVCWSPDGTRLASASWDKTVREWDAKTGEKIGSSLRGHRDWVHSVAWSPNGRLLASGSADKTIIIWDARTGKQAAARFKGHKHRVNDVVWSPDGLKLASASWDKTLRVWDVRTGKQIEHSLTGHEHPAYKVSWSPDGTRLASASGSNTDVWVALLAKAQSSHRAARRKNPPLDLKVAIKTSLGRKTTVMLSSKHNIKEVKQILSRTAALDKVPVERQRLLLGRDVLERDWETLGDLGVVTGDELQLVPRKLSEEKPPWTKKTAWGAVTSSRRSGAADEGAKRGRTESEMYTEEAVKAVLQDQGLLAEIAMADAEAGTEADAKAAASSIIRRAKITDDARRTMANRAAARRREPKEAKTSHSMADGTAARRSALQEVHSIEVAKRLMAKKTNTKRADLAYAKKMVEDFRSESAAANAQLDRERQRQKLSLQRRRLKKVLKSVMSDKSEAELRRAFHELDTSGDGIISTVELLHFCTTHGAKKMTSEAAGDLVEWLDADHSGSIGWGEFKGFVGQVGDLGRKRQNSMRRMEKDARRRRSIHTKTPTGETLEDRIASAGHRVSMYDEDKKTAELISEKYEIEIKAADEQRARQRGQQRNKLRQRKAKKKARIAFKHVLDHLDDSHGHVIDLDGDGMLSREEKLQAFHVAMVEYDDGDGILSVDEFSQMLSGSIGMEKSEINMVVQMLDVDGDEHIDAEELLALVRDHARKSAQNAMEQKRRESGNSGAFATARRKSRARRANTHHSTSRRASKVGEMKDDKKRQEEEQAEELMMTARHRRTTSMDNLGLVQAIDSTFKPPPPKFAPRNPPTKGSKKPPPPTYAPGRPKKPTKPPPPMAPPPGRRAKRKVSSK